MALSTGTHECRIPRGEGWEDGPVGKVLALYYRVIQSSLARTSKPFCTLNTGRQAGSECFYGSLCGASYERNLSVHMDVCGVCICHAVGVEAREAPQTSSLNLFEAGSRMFAAVCTRLAGHELSERLCAFHFRSFHSSTGFIDGAALPGFPWVLGMRKSPPSCLCSKHFPHYAVFQA